MQKPFVISLVSVVLILTGCTQQSPSEIIKQNTDTPITSTTKLIDISPKIISTSFNGNGITIEGKNLSGYYVSFTTPPSKTFCREMVTPNCILQKTVSTDTTISFISNIIGEQGSYQIYVENKTDKSNVVELTIP